MTTHPSCPTTSNQLTRKKDSSKCNTNQRSRIQDHANKRKEKKRREKRKIKIEGGGERLVHVSTPRLNLFLWQRCNPKTPFDHTRHGLERVLGAGIDQTEEILHDSSRGAMSLEVNQRLASLVVDLSWLLRIVGEVVDVKTCFIS